MKTNDTILIVIALAQSKKLLPNKIKLDIEYEDKDLIIINKPKGMVVHPGAGNYKNTLAKGLIYKYRNQRTNINGELRPGILHRIDKETRVAVVAKNNLAHSKLESNLVNIQLNIFMFSLGVIRPMKGQIKSLISRSKKPSNDDS